MHACIHYTLNTLLTQVLPLDLIKAATSGVPAIVEEPHYESGTDDPDSRTNLDQLKVCLSSDSALRSLSMCNVIPDNCQGHEQPSSVSTP